MGRRRRVQMKSRKNAFYSLRGLAEVDSRACQKPGLKKQGLRGWAVGSGVPGWFEAQEKDVEKVFLMLARPWEGKEDGRETGKDEERKVTSTLSNVQLHRFWGTTPWHRELQVRPLQTYKKWCVDPDRHAQAVVAMFGQLIVCKERCDRNCGMAKEGGSGQVGESERHRQDRSSGQLVKVIRKGVRVRLVRE